MGHRTNGLPILYLVPDAIVEDHRLRRLQHHTLTPYSDAEGIRLLKEQWSGIDKSGVYVTALDECYTVALLNGGPQKYLRSNMFLRKNSDGCDPDGSAFATEYKQTHRDDQFLFQHERLGLRLDLLKTSDNSPRIAESSRRHLLNLRTGKEHSCLKAVASAIAHHEHMVKMVSVDADGGL